MNIGPLEIVVLVILVLLLVGGRRLPDAGRWLGGGVRNFFDSVRGLHPEDEPTPPPELENGSTEEKPDST
jgi:sec-independent protein translocase protein TatA